MAEITRLDIIISKLPPCIAITPVLSTKETKDSLIIGDEHLDTIPKKESDEFIKSSVENLVPNPSECEDECGCDLLVCDDFTTFSNILFDADDDFSFSDDKSFSDEDILKEIYSNPHFDKEIISIKIDPHHFNAESDLIESLLNQDSSIISFSKIDSLLDYDSLMEEIDLSLILNDSMPLGIKNDDYESEGDILILEELLSNDSLFHLDIPSSPRPPAKPPDDDEIEPNSRILPVKVHLLIPSQYLLLLPGLLVLLSQNFLRRPTLASHVVSRSQTPYRRLLTRPPSSNSRNSPPRVPAAEPSVGNPQKALKDKGVIDSRCSRHMTGNMSYLSYFKELNGGQPVLTTTAKTGNPQQALKDKGVIDSGCSRHMTGTMSYLSDLEELNGGYVVFGGNPKGGKIIGKVLTQSKPISNTVVRPVSAALSNITVTRPRHAHQVVTKFKSPIRRHKTHSPSSRTSNSPPRVTAVQALVVSAAQGKQGTWVWRPTCPILDHDF
nr:ribonuclease H-like domain-containing protein [Tanacetum cinerariifolium]